MYKSIFGEEKKTKEKDSRASLRHSVFRTIGLMEYSIDQLGREKGKIISLAREAKRRGDDTAYRSLKKRLSVCLVNTRLISEMLSQLEIALQLDNMDRMVESYSSCMEDFKKKYSIANNQRTLLKSYKDARCGIDQTIDFYSDLYESLSFNRVGFLDEGSDAIPDGELEQMIRAESDRSDKNVELDEKIQLVRSRIKEVRS